MTERGIQWANIPGDHPELARDDLLTGRRSSVVSIIHVPSDQPNLSGVIRKRPRGVPASVSLSKARNLDAFGNVTF